MVPSLASEVEVVKSLVFEARERFEAELRLQTALPVSRLVTLRPGELLPIEAQRRRVGQISAVLAEARPAEAAFMIGVFAG